MTALSVKRRCDLSNSDQRVTIIKECNMKIMLVGGDDLSIMIDLFEDALRGHGFVLKGHLNFTED